MKTKRFLSALTSLVIAATCISPICSYAESVVEKDTNSFSAVELANIYTEDEFMDCIEVLKSSSDYMDISSDLSTAYIGTPFFMNYIDTDYTLKEKTDTIYFPVVADDDVCAFIIATKNDGYISFSCGEFFADRFDETGITGNFSLVFDKYENVYTIDENKNVSVMIEYCDVLDITSDMLGDATLAITSIDDAKTNTLDVSTINVASPNSVNTIIDYKLNNYPCYTQSGSNCWAYVIMSMTKYKQGRGSIDYIYNAFYRANGYNYDYNGASFSEAYNTIVELFSEYSPVKHTGGVLSGNAIASTIGNDLPAFIAGESSSGGQHAVALMGYRMDSNYSIPGNVSGIYTMNTQTGKINYNSYNPNGCSFSGFATTYDWQGSVTLK